MESVKKKLGSVEPVEPAFCNSVRQLRKHCPVNLSFNTYSLSIQTWQNQLDHLSLNLPVTLSDWHCLIDTNTPDCQIDTNTPDCQTDTVRLTLTLHTDRLQIPARQTWQSLILRYQITLNWNIFPHCIVLDQPVTRLTTRVCFYTDSSRWPLKLFATRVSFGINAFFYFSFMKAVMALASYVVF